MSTTLPKIARPARLGGPRGEASIARKKVYVVADRRQVHADRAGDRYVIFKGKRYYIDRRNDLDPARNDDWQTLAFARGGVARRVALRAETKFAPGHWVTVGELNFELESRNARTPGWTSECYGGAGGRAVQTTPPAPSRAARWVGAK